MSIDWNKLKQYLDEKVEEYNHVDFIENDPIQIPHRFSQKEDIEISAFFAATFAWGKRETIIKKTSLLLEKMDDAPFDFVMNHKPKDLKSLEQFKHRTFNFVDLQFFLTSLKSIYQEHSGLENTFSIQVEEVNMCNAIERFRTIFLSISHETRSKKHLSSPQKGSAAKRINMFLRWMVRKDEKGVDFGIWKNIPRSSLSCPLDVHSGRVARQLQILNRHQNDWKAVEELDNALRKLDPQDPTKYDFALFGIGVDQNKMEQR